MTVRILLVYKENHQPGKCLWPAPNRTKREHREVSCEQQWKRKDGTRATLRSPWGQLRPPSFNFERQAQHHHNMAQALGAALEKPAEMFALIQAEWDVRQAEKPDAAILARARILARYPLREMLRRGWIDPEHRTGTLEEQVCRFFGVESLDDVPHLAHSAKKTDYSDVPPSQLAWLFRVRQIASEMHPNSPYNPSKLREAIEAFKEMRDEVDAVRHVPGLLDDAGVRFVVVESLPGSLIDGVCFWLNPIAPVIGLSFRFDRIDNFWFVLRHECAHVLHGHGKDRAILDQDMEVAPSSSQNEEEQIANAEAADFCVPAEQIKSFYLRKKPFFSETDVLAFRKE